MTPARSRAFQPRRDRREVAIAVLAVAVILLVTGGLLALFAPHDDTASVPSSPTITLPTDPSLPPDTSVASIPTTAAPAP